MLGAAFKKNEMWEPALAAYEEALRLDARSAKLWLGKGTSLYRLGRFEEALASYDKAAHIVKTG